MSELPEGWAWATLQDAAANEPNAMTDGPFGSKLKTADYTDEGIRVVRLGNLGVGRFVDKVKAYIKAEKFETLRKHEVFPGDLIIAALAEPVGRCVPVPKSLGLAVVKADCIRLKPRPDVLTPYLMHALNSPSGRRRAEDVAHGVGRLRINMGEMRELKFPLPPLNEQKRIVAKIDALTEKSREAREALDEVPQLLDKLRQSILAAAFRGDLTARWREQNPDVEPASVLVEKAELPGGKSTGRAASEQVIEGRAALSVGDPERPVPRSWLRVPMLRVARLESGHTPSRKHPEWWGGDVPWIGIGDARDNHGRTILTTDEQTNEDGLANSAARLLPKDTVCLSRTASVGYVTKMGTTMATSQDFVNWVCTSALLPDYLLYAFLAEGEHLLKFGKGSTHTTIYFPEVKAFHIALPPLEEQREIVRLVQERLVLVDQLKGFTAEKRSALTQLDPSILAKAFRGELVPQDPSDEPASVLLERIRAEREVAGGGKKEKTSRTKKS